MRYEVPGAPGTVVQQGPTVQATSLFPPDQPDQARFALLQQLRYQVTVVAWLENLQPLPVSGQGPGYSSMSLSWLSPVAQIVDQVYPVIA